MEYAETENKMSAQGDRLLILAVDRDGDLEGKTKVRSPVFGREGVLSAATQLAISDPEEADANSFFAAIKEYDRLQAMSEGCEIAVVCGVPDSGVDADRKIKREIENILSKGQFSAIVLVTDGAEDEQILPILQSMKPVASVVRIVVKHSRTVEETYMVLGRYLRMLVFDDRYSKWVIGVPGVIFLFAGVLVLFGRAYEAGIAILLILGSAFFVRGFGVDRSVASMLSQRPYGYLRIFSAVASLLIFLVGISTGFTNLQTTIPDIMKAVDANPSLFSTYGSQIIGTYLEGALPLVWAAFAIYLIGVLLAHLARGSRRVWRDAVLIVLLGLLYLPTDQFAVFLTAPTAENSSVLLVSYVLVGLAVTFAVVTALYGRIRSRNPLSSSDPSA
jgi:putative membrane protein